MDGAARTHYEVLGISRDADAAEVRRAWKLLVQVWHPDRFSGEMAEAAQTQTAAINEAYQVLRDSSRRAAYDCRLAADEDSDREARRGAQRERRRPAAATAPRVHATHPHAQHVRTPAPPPDGLRAFGDELVSIVRRHPRVLGAVAAAWLLVFGGSALMHMLAGPSLPSGASIAAAATDTTVVTPHADTELPELDELATRAREDAERANEELADMLAQDAAQPSVDADPRAGSGAGATPALPKAQQPHAAPRIQELPRPGGGRILRVMPG